MTGGRAIFGSGPGALASDAHTLGIDPMTQRDRQDEAIAVIRRLFNGERVTAKTDWFEMHDAALQILPLQEDMTLRTSIAIAASNRSTSRPSMPPVCAGPPALLNRQSIRPNFSTASAISACICSSTVTSV